MLVFLALTDRNLSGEQKLPSIASRIDAPQIVALACVGALGMISLMLFYGPSHGATKALVTCGILGAPYILLIVMAFKAAVSERASAGFGS